MNHHGGIRKIVYGIFGLAIVGIIFQYLVLSWLAISIGRSINEQGLRAVIERIWEGAKQ